MSCLPTYDIVVVVTDYDVLRSKPKVYGETTLVRADPMTGLERRKRFESPIWDSITQHPIPKLASRIPSMSDNSAERRMLSTIAVETSSSSFCSESWRLVEKSSKWRTFTKLSSTSEDLAQKASMIGCDRPLIYQESDTQDVPDVITYLIVSQTKDECSVVSTSP